MSKCYNSFRHRGDGDTRREISMTTSKKVAKKAGKQLKDKKSTPSEKSVAGSDLEQAKKKGKKKK
jgi:hypothetical protein